MKTTATQYRNRKQFGVKNTFVIPFSDSLAEALVNAGFDWREDSINEDSEDFFMIVKMPAKTCWLTDRRGIEFLSELSLAKFNLDLIHTDAASFCKRVDIEYVEPQFINLNNLMTAKAEAEAELRIA